MITALVVTYKDKGFPHLEALEESNPNIQIIPIKDDRPHDTLRAWRTCDEMLRNWWFHHRDLADGKIIWWIEWDCLVTTKLPSLPLDADFGAKQLWTSRAWPYWQEKTKLGPYERCALGASPTGVTCYRREVLSRLLNTRYDPFYNADIFSEIRTPSLLVASGARPCRLLMPDVHCRKPEQPFKIGKGIYHPVKP